MRKEIRATYSVRRKRDFVTLLAVLLFLLMIAGQLYIILLLPVRLRRQDALERDVLRMQVVAQFDDLRLRARRAVGRDDLQRGEIALVQGVFDSFYPSMNYLRDHGEHLSLDQILAHQNLLNRYLPVVLRWQETPPPPPGVENAPPPRRSEFLIHRETLDFPACRRKLEERLPRFQSTLKESVP